MQKYLRTNVTPIEEVRQELWNAGTAREVGDAPGLVPTLEQYKLYVEMADRVSARRSLTNTFFLTLNTAVLTVIGSLWKERSADSPWPLVLPLLAALVQCAAWFLTVRSYRQLNAAKYTVIGALEERLPASPYWKAEWKALGEGRDASKYWQLHSLEQWIPAVFAAVYAGACIATLVG
ncbi:MULTISPECIES: hypothetical protein [unclassified Streptomyces]|uniref:RipA family octameric membrane protein n=1 Tax=unclassified Streptomyces TaxID=2593676 RepID=UPI0035D8FA91